MINEIANFTQQLWQTGRKLRRSQSGWVTGNAVCCNHNGESADTRGRGGIIISDGNVTYHCFNCKFKASYGVGRPLSFKFRKLLSWMGAEAKDINRLVIEALRLRDLIAPDQIQPESEPVTFQPKSLPDEALSFYALAEFYELQKWKSTPQQFHDVVAYVHTRKIDMIKYEFFWSPIVDNKMSHRVIVPFKYKNEIVGYSARAVRDGIYPKYHSDHPSDFVFNLDNQRYDNKFVIVCEGVFDAMSIDGVSIQGNELSEQQAELIEALGKQVIVVPDFDKHLNNNNKTVWPGSKLIDTALQYDWHVSFPIWHTTCKDVNSAVSKYGKLFTLKAILDACESNKLKIKLQQKKYGKRI